ncbi:MAG: hypothetical protein HZB59_04210 [Ignavibacteriales bacterium]|nr:hypothetical protein [Ignavibacteriales bacterium]
MPSAKVTPPEADEPLAQKRTSAIINGGGGEQATFKAIPFLELNDLKMESQSGIWYRLINSTMIVETEIKGLILYRSFFPSYGSERLYSTTSMSRTERTFSRRRKNHNIGG